jgi:hypothetical protein
MGILIVILVALGVGIWLGFIVGFSRAMRDAAKRIQGTKRPIIAKLAIGLGCAALVIGIASWLHTYHFTRIAQRTSGTVIEMREMTDKDSGSVSYAPTFRFQDTNGSQHIVTSSLFSSPPEFHVGDSVTVLYRGDDPQTARIDSYWQVWGLPSILGIISSAELLIGLIVLFWPKFTARFGGQTAHAQTV